MRALTGRTRVLGVFGFPVGHSLSPAMHNAALSSMSLDYTYVPFEVHPIALGSAIEGVRALGIAGVNLTIPHKERVLPLLDDITPRARSVGAVNTVVNVEGRLIGHNTDGYGFVTPLADLGFDAAGKRTLVVGAGGAARSVVFALVEAGAGVTIHNRTPERGVRLAEDAGRLAKGRVRTTDNLSDLKDALATADLLVNATSAGMAPCEDPVLPAGAGALRPSLVVYDLVYRPLETQLVRAARAVGCLVVTGDKMLMHQGARALEIWTGKTPPLEVMASALREALAS